MGMRWGYGQKVAMAIVYGKLMELDDQDFVDETFDGIEWVNVLEGNRSDLWKVAKDGIWQHKHRR